MDQGTLQRNFKGYSTQADTDMLALGVSGISQVAGAFLQNHTDLDQYGERLRTGQLATRRGFWLNDDDRLRREVINRLACQGRLDLAALARRHGVDARVYFARQWQRLIELETDGLVRLDGTEITVTPPDGRCYDRFSWRSTPTCTRTPQRVTRKYCRTFKRVARLPKSKIGSASSVLPRLLTVVAHPPFPVSLPLEQEANLDRFRQHLSQQRTVHSCLSRQNRADLAARHGAQPRLGPGPGQ